MRTPRSFLTANVVMACVAVTVALAVHVSTRAARDQDGPDDPRDRRGTSERAAASAQPALTVSIITPRSDVLPIKIAANGDITAWQEAVIGAEANGLRLATVNVNVGDVVRRGRVLAVFVSDTVAAELAQSRAAVAEAEAALAEAEDNVRRSEELSATGALSAQQIHQYATAERTARARLEAARATANMHQLRLGQTQVLAPDDGVISARSATVGAVLSAGDELFRLIRGGRLEWRAGVAASDLVTLKPGQIAHVTPTGGRTIAGRLRMVAPTVDPQNRNATVYVDLPRNAAARAGMFARGEFDIGAREMMTLPQSAVLPRDGFSYVMRVGADSKVERTKVTVGRREGDRVEITGGIDASTQVVASGGSFLGDGDLVRVVPGMAGGTR